MMKKKFKEEKAAEAEVTIINRLGLHARAAGHFRRLAAGFAAEIEVSHGHITANGKSLIGLLALEGSQGIRLKIKAHGPDAEEAVQALADLVSNRFGESE